MGGTHHLGDLQYAIMRVLWDEGEATVARVQEALADDDDRDRALTTIATMLSKMEKKGVVDHRTEGRQFIYRTLISEKDVHRSMVADLTERLFQGDFTALVSHLLTEQEIDKAELERLKGLIAERGSKERRRGRYLIAFGLCAWLLTYALHSTVLIGAAWLATVLFAKLRSSRGMSTAVRERLWRAALLGGVVTAGIQIATGFAPFSVRWALAEPVVLESRAEPLPALATLDRFSATQPWAPRRSYEPVDARPLSAPVLFSEPSISSPAAVAPIASGSHTALDATWVRVLVFVWLAGAILGALHWSLEWRRLFRCLRGRSPIAFGTARTVFENLLARTGVRSTVRLSSAPGIAAPITFGLHRAEICLPPRTLDGLQREELEALLAHELAHAVRRDGAWLVLYRAIEILFFFQPLNRLARIRLQDDAEYLCDDWAVVHTGERVALASCLTEIAGWILHERRLLPAPSMAARGSRLSLRVRRLLDEAHRPVRAVPRHGLSVLALSVVAAVAFCAPGVDAESRSAGDDREFDVRGAAPKGEDAEVAPEPDGTDSDDEGDGARDADGVRDAFDQASDARENASDARAAERSRDERASGAGFDPDAITDAFDSALTVQAIADEIAALEHDFGVLASAAEGAPEILRKRVGALRGRLRSLRERQARVEALVELQAQWAETPRAQPSALDATARVPNE